MFDRLKTMRQKISNILITVLAVKWKGRQEGINSAKDITLAFSYEEGRDMLDIP